MQESINRIVKKKIFLVLGHVNIFKYIDPISFTINKNGNYFLSKYHSSLVKNFNTLTQRGEKIENKAPGPGHYDVSK